MGNNQDHNKEIDQEYENAKRSMGSRMDSDPETPKPEETPKPQEETPKAEEKPQETPKPEENKDVTPPKQEADTPKDEPKDTPPVNRGERYIPLAKFHDTERKHKQELAERDAKIAELQKISEQKPSEQKDEDIEAFMAKTGFDRETVDGLLALAEKRVMTPEIKSVLEKESQKKRNEELDASFSVEFAKDGEPAVKNYFPNATAEQVEKAKAFLNQVAHTKAFADKTLDYVVFKNQEQLKSIFNSAEEDADETPAPQTKKTIEGHRMGTGKPTGLTAKDFDGKTDFSILSNMEQSARNELIKSFPDKTYDAFNAWVASQNEGIQVTRNGQKVTLK